MEVVAGPVLCIFVCYAGGEDVCRTSHSVPNMDKGMFVCECVQRGVVH